MKDAKSTRIIIKDNCHIHDNVESSDFFSFEILLRSVIKTGKNQGLIEKCQG